MNLSQKVSTSMVLVIFLVFAVFLGVEIHKTTMTERANFDKRIKYIADITEIANKVNLWNLDLEDARVFLNSILEANELYAVVFQDKDQVFIAGVKDPDISIFENTEISSLPLDPSKYQVEIKREIKYFDQPLGHAVLYFNTGSIASAVKKSITSVVALFVMISLIIIILVYVLVRKIILEPFLSLNTAADQLAGKLDEVRSNLLSGDVIDDQSISLLLDTSDLKGRLEKRKDEIGVFFRSFTTMFETIRAALEQVTRYSVELKTLNTELENRVQDRTQKLISTNDSLTQALDRLKNAQSTMVQQERLASIGQLAAGVAHEINNPTGFIMSNLRTLSGYIDDVDAVVAGYNTMKSATDYESFQTEVKNTEKLEEEHDFKFIISDIKDITKDSVEGMYRIKDIVDNLKNYARIDHVENIAPVDINAAIKSTLKLLSNEIKYVAEVKTEFGDIPEVMGHAGQLNQVFANLLVNGAHAIRDQQRDKMGRLIVKTRRDGEFVICEFTDDGPGIPEEARPRIFDPFFTTKAVGKGTGLGLSISHEIIVQKHSGSLKYYTKLGVGTRFEVRLPIKREGENGNTE